MDKFRGESEFLDDSHTVVNEETVHVQTSPDSPDEAVAESSPKTGEQLSHEIMSKLSIILHKAVLEGVQSKRTHNQTQNYTPVDEQLVSERESFLKKRSGKGVEERSIQNFIAMAPDAKKVSIGQTGRLDSVKEDGYLYEMFTREIIPESAVQADSISQEPATTIEEVVVSSTKVDADISSFEGALVTLTNKVNGAKLCLNDLLPLGTTLIPSGFRAVGQYARETYVNQQGQASFYPKKQGYNYVEYKNIDTNEGMLSTLHEIAHSWQEIYHPKATSDHVMMNKIIDIADKVACAQKSLSYFSPGEEVPDSVLEVIKETMGIDGDTDVETYVSKYIEIGTAVLARYGLTVNNSEIQNDNSSASLVEMAENYVWTERHAWSTALRLGRICEENGVMPNPNAQEDIGTGIKTALQTYQDSLNFLKIKGIKSFTVEKDPLVD